MDLSRVTTISFDCYGTLIDWESGILPVLRGLLSDHGQSLADAAILELYAEFEAQAESGPYRSYREVLQSVVRGFAERFNFQTDSAEIDSLHESVIRWLPFPDTVPALRELRKRYKLAVISNIDDDLFAETRKHLAVEFDGVTTAEQARSYKPSINNFEIHCASSGFLRGNCCMPRRVFITMWCRRVHLESQQCGSTGSLPDRVLARCGLPRPLTLRGERISRSQILLVSQRCLRRPLQNECWQAIHGRLAATTLTAASKEFFSVSPPLPAGPYCERRVCASN